MGLNAGPYEWRRPPGERLVIAVAVLIVVELVAGLTGLVALRRIAAERPAERTLAWTPEAEPLPSRTPVVPVPATIAPVGEVTPSPAAPTEAASAPAPTIAAEPAPAPQAAPPSPSPATAAPQPAAPAPPPPAPAPRVHTAGQSDSERRFGEQFPVQAAARQIEGDRSTFHWAVIVGVNRYQGRTKHTIGSVADALLLRQLLLQRGWREDHILLLTDGNATHDAIVRGLEWLARSTDARSTVVFSFSGHMRYQRSDPDGDGEYYDSGLWPTDNRYLWDSDFARMVNAIPAQRMWLALQGCHAGGMNDAGLEAPGRVITYSSLEREKSFEDPEVGHSVQGWYMFAEGVRDRHGDANRDGSVSVQEAHHWGAPRAHVRTGGRQSPQLFDGLGRPFALEVS